MSAIKGWEDKRLVELADFINGFAFKPEDWGKEGLPIIRIEQLKNPKTIEDYYRGKLPSRNTIENGDLIFSWSASLFLKIWRHGTAALNQHLFKVVEHDGVQRDFLKFFIEFHIGELAKSSHGSTMQHITRKELERFHALFPVDEKEQTQIAAILSSIEKAIEQFTAIIAKHKDVSAGLMQDLLSRGIDDKGNIRAEGTHNFKDAPMGRIPAEWDTRRFEEITPRNAPICYGILQTGPFDPSGVPVAGIYSINSDFDQIHMSSPKIAARYRRSRIRGGDVLVSVKGTTGRVCVVPRGFEGNISRDVARIRLERDVKPEYLMYLMRSPRFQRYLETAVVGTTRSEISIGILRSLSVALPSPAQQESIVRILSASDAVSAAQIRVLEKLKRSRMGLLHDFITGAVRVTEMSMHHHEAQEAAN